MEYGINLLAAVPIRKQPSDKSEMISQLLFGEVVKVLDDSKRMWTYIQCEYDEYNGWISRNQVHPIDREEYERASSHQAVSVELCCPTMSNHFSRNITFGASLPGFDEMSFTIDKRNFSFGGQVMFVDRLGPRAPLIRKLARKFLNTPYLWGGRSSFGIDCSGLTQIVFKAVGIRLPRDSSQQIHYGELVDFAAQAITGDLAFFSGPYKDYVTHVGIVLEPGVILHASEHVRIDKLDHVGIYNKERKKYTHKLIAIKRILNEQDHPIVEEADFSIAPE